MPQLTFPITAAGLTVDARVNLDGATLTALRAANRPAPAAVSATALIDTGSDISAVAPAVLQALAIPPHSQATTRGIGGLVPVRLFRVALSILDASRPHLPWLVEPDLLVMEMPPGVPYDVLIGMDVVLGCRVLVDGPARQLTIDF